MKANEVSNIMTEAQKNTYLSLGTLNLQLEEHLIAIVDKYKLPRTKSVKDFTRLNIVNPRKNIFTLARDLQEIVLAACYIWQPALRNNWANLEITRKAVGLTNDLNWLQVKRTGSMSLILNTFNLLMLWFPDH